MSAVVGMDLVLLFCRFHIEFTHITLFSLVFYATTRIQFGCLLLHVILPCHHDIFPLWCYFELSARSAVSFSACIQHWLVNHGLNVFWGCSIHSLSLIMLCGWRAFGTAAPHVPCRAPVLASPNILAVVPYCSGAGAPDCR